MSSLTDRMLALGDRAAAAVLTVYRAFTGGTVSVDELGELAAGHIVRGSTLGRAAAVQEYALAHYAALGAPPAGPLGAHLLGEPLGQHDRIAAASVEIVTEPPERAAGEPDMRLERLARSEIYLATQRQYRAVLLDDNTATGWTRGMHDDACQLCGWWARTNRVWPLDHPLQTHPGCRCEQIPVFRGADDNK